MPLALSQEIFRIASSPRGTSAPNAFLSGLAVALLLWGIYKRAFSFDRINLCLVSECDFVTCLLDLSSVLYLFLLAPARKIFVFLSRVLKC
jgi:hypothetical protein